MTHHVRIFDDYGASRLWAADADAVAVAGVGPLDALFDDRISPETCAPASPLLERSAASLNQTHPPDGCLWPLGERLASDLVADGLLTRPRTGLGGACKITDARNRLAP